VSALRCRLNRGSFRGKADEMQGQDYAIFTEFSPDTKAMIPGFNIRVFTDCDSQRGNAIRCDFKTGVITLAPGTYHITGFSMATYNSGCEPPEMSTIRSPAAAGYCRLRTYDPTVKSTRPICGPFRTTMPASSVSEAVVQRT
jgi:hypothetical protein